MDLQYIPGIGPKRAEILQSELHVSSDEDLLTYFPYRYVDKSKIYTIREIDGTMPYILLKGCFTMFEEKGQGTGGHRLVGTFTDGTGTIDCVWFQGIKYVLNSVQRGKEYLLFGQPKEFNYSVNIAHPDLEIPAPDGKEVTGLMGM